MRKQLGVTLVELLTVMVIVGVLAAIAIPSYDAYVRKARRADAKAALNGMAQQLERCYTRLNSYNDGTNDTTGVCPTGLPGPTSTGTYQLTLAFDTTAGLPAGQSYTLTATALGNQAKDTHCATFTMNQQSARTATSTDCW